MAVDPVTTPPAVPGKRNTRQRTAVLRAMSDSDDFLTPQQWHDMVRRQGDAVGLTTVYRTLAALADSGMVDTIVDEHGEARYRRCEEEEHHHHLVCRVCGATVEVAAGPVEAWAQRTATDHGYTNPVHTVEIFGTCPQCART
jgi:Fur family transcriptional regulator, ferric uptake regulator